MSEKRIVFYIYDSGVRSTGSTLKLGHKYLDIAVRKELQAEEI